jgi:hypothetical protein
MKKIWLGMLLPALAVAAIGGSALSSQGKRTLVVPAVPNPAMSVPDETAWRVFIQAVSPAGNKLVAFQTWPSDGTTFSPTAKVLPQTAALLGAAATPDQIDARPPVLPNAGRALHGTGAAPSAGGSASPAVALVGAAAPDNGFQTPLSASEQPINNPLPPGLASGGCTTTDAQNNPINPNRFEPACDPGTTEEVRRNPASHNFIVTNHLNSRSGLIQAFASKTLVNFPVDSVEVKMNWIPVSLLPTYYPASKPTDFYIATDMVQGSTQQYALIAMHVISKQVPNWTWATFEHEGNRGRCDFLGCHDAFGATTPNVPAVDNDGTNQGSVYPACAKTPAVLALFAAAKLNPVFAHYCLKGSQADFTDPTGLAVRLGNSVTEGTFVPQASCMSCHGSANINARGKSTTFFGFIGNTGQVGPINPLYYWSQQGGRAYYGYQPALERTAIAADFVWSIPFCAYDDTVQPAKKSFCASK